MSTLHLRKRADKTGPEPAEGEAWPLQHVELLSDPPATHVLSDTFVATAAAEGWLTVDGARIGTTDGYDRDPVITGAAIVLHLVDGDLRYRITEHPGRYPDAGEPAGVRVTHAYRLELEPTDG